MFAERRREKGITSNPAMLLGLVVELPSKEFGELVDSIAKDEWIRYSDSKVVAILVNHRRIACGANDLVELGQRMIKEFPGEPYIWTLCGTSLEMSA